MSKEIKTQALGLMKTINSDLNKLNALFTKYNEKVSKDAKTNLIKVLALADEKGDTFIGDFYGAYKDIYNANGEDAAQSRLQLKNVLSAVGGYIKGGIKGAIGGAKDGLGGSKGNSPSASPSDSTDDSDKDKKILGMKKPIFYTILAIIIIIIVIIVIKVVKKS